MHRKTSDDYHALANKRGIIWLGSEVAKTELKTEWKCPHGHSWRSSYHSVKLNGCPVCAGNAPKLSSDYHELAGQRGFIWLGPEVNRTGAKTNWQCSQGHKWSTHYNSIQQGRGCPVCSGNVKRIEVDYHKLARSKNFNWVGSVVVNTHIATKWRCSKGHIWDASYHSIQGGSGCPMCAGLNPKKPSDYFAIAIEYGFRWLGPEVENSRKKTTWECTKGHQWKASFNTIQQGRGCRICGYEKNATDKRLKPSDYQTLANVREFKWIGPEVKNNREYTNWKCSKGHLWKTKFINIQQGKGCPYCSRKARKTSDDFHKLAEERGFIWLGTNVKNIFTKTVWQCKQGHQWEVHYNSIQQGRGCPKCIDLVNGAPVSKNQRQLCEMLGGELNYPCGRYRIDVALRLENIAIAIEYDSWYWHGNKLNYDSRRDDDLISTGWSVIRVKSRRLLPSKAQIEKAIVNFTKR